MNDAAQFTSVLEFLDQFLLDAGPKLVGVSAATFKTKEPFLCGVEVAFVSKETRLGVWGEFKFCFYIGALLRRRCF